MSRASKKQIQEWTEQFAAEGFPVEVEIAYGGYKFQQSKPGTTAVVRDLSTRLTGREAMLWLEGFQAAATFARRAAR